MTFKALLTSKSGDAITASIVSMEDDDLMDGDVAVAVEYSTVNYKVSLALSEKIPIIARFP